MFFNFAYVYGKYARNALFFHRDAVQSVRRLHRSAPVRYDDELRLVVTVQILRVTDDIDVVKRRLDLVEQTERSGSYRHYRKIQRDRGQRLLSARKR